MAAKRKVGNRKVKRAMHEMKQGTLRSGRSGKKVTNPRQAIAIGLAEARRAGAHIPKKKVGARKKTAAGTKNSRRSGVRSSVIRKGTRRRARKTPRRSA